MDNNDDDDNEVSNLAVCTEAASLDSGAMECEDRDTGEPNSHSRSPLKRRATTAVDPTCHPWMEVVNSVDIADRVQMLCGSWNPGLEPRKITDKNMLKDANYQVSCGLIHVQQ